MTKYSIIVEAVIQQTDTQKKAFQKALDAAIFKDLTLKISKIALDEGAIKHLQDSVKKALKDVGFDLDKLKKDSKKAGDIVGEAVKEGVESQAKNVAHDIFKNLEDSAIETARKLESLTPYKKAGFEVVSAKERFQFGEDGERELASYNVQLERLEGNVKSTATALITLDKENGEVLQSINTTAVAVESITEKERAWRIELEALQSVHTQAFQSKEVQQQLKSVEKAMMGAVGTPTRENIRKVKMEMANLRNEVKKNEDSVNQYAKTFSGMMVTAMRKIALWGIGTSLIYGTKRQFEDMIQYVQDLNKELTNIQVVTDMSNESTRKLATRFNELAVQLGATTLEVARGSVEWFRQGKTIEETAKLLEATTMMSKLGNVEAAQATEYLTSVLNGFKLEAQDAMSVVDKLVNLDNQYATSVSEIASAMQRSSNSAQQAGVTFDELASYITVISSVTRKSAESIGESFKTIFARLQNIKLGSQFEDDATTINDVEKALSLVNIKIRETEDTFRPMGDVMDEVAGKWSTMTEIEQSAIATTIAGIRQRENFLALMENYDEVLKAQEIAMNSAGLATQRYQVYLDSSEAATNRFRAAWEKLAASTISSDLVIFFTNLGTSILGVADNVGILMIALVGLITVFSRGLLETGAIAFFRMFTSVITGVTAASGAAAVSIGGFTVAVTALQVATGLIVFVGVIAAIGLLIKKFDEAKVTIEETRDAFVEAQNEFNNNFMEVEELASAYERLAEKTDKTTQDMFDLANIVSILNTKYGMATDELDLFSDAMEGDTQKINNNTIAILENNKARAKEFLLYGKAKLEEAKKFMETPVMFATGAVGSDAFGRELLTQKEILNVLQERMVAEKESDGVWHKAYKNKLDEIDAYEEVISVYRLYLELYNEVVGDKGGGDYRELRTLQALKKIIADSKSEVVSFIDSLKGLSGSIESALSLYDQWYQTQELSSSQILNIIDNYNNRQELLTISNG